MSAAIAVERHALAGRDGGEVARVVLVRPERANSLTAEMLEELCAALEELQETPPAALVLAGAGRHFSTGGDVARFASEVAAGRGRAYAARTVGALNRCIERLVALPCPVIAQVQGALTGGALGLMLAADMVAMAEDAFIQPWYAVVGFAPDGGWSAMLPDRIGPARALQVQHLNRAIPAPEALSLGLVQALAPAADLPGITAGWLADIAAHRAGAMAASRALVWSPERRARLAQALEAERLAFVERIETEETRAGMAAFLARLKGEN